MAEVNLDNGISYNGSGSELLDGTIVRTIDQNGLMPEHKEYRALMGYTNENLISPDQKYGAKYPNGGLKKIGEAGNKAVRSFTFGPKKGIYQEEFSEKFESTFLFTEWIKNAKTLSGAPDNVQAELVNMSEQVEDLVSGWDVTYAENMVELWTKGFDITTPEGPGSAGAKGLALFNAANTIKATGTTFSNIITATPYTDEATGIAQLQAAIDLHKVMVLDNGKKVKQPKGGYNLYCSRLREVFWKKVLNNGSDKSGQGTNSAEQNQFNFNNNLVNLKVIDLIGDLNREGEAIGTDDMWFLTNPLQLTKGKCFKDYKLYEPVVKNWVNDETDVYNTSLRGILGVDHYYAEYGIVGGNATT